MLKLTTDKHEASRGLSATAELLVLSFYYGRQIQLLLYGTIRCCVFNPLEPRGNYSAISNNMKVVHWPSMGGDWAGPQAPRSLLAVPNVTAHPSTATVPIIVGLLQYNGPLLCGFYLAMICIIAVYAGMRCLYVCLSVRHVRELRQNE